MSENVRDGGCPDIDGSDRFVRALDDAERLMKYAAEIGIEDITPETRQAVLHARSIPPDQWTQEVTGNLLAALTDLAARLKPVTAASLKAYDHESRPTVRGYFIQTLILAAIVVPISVATFINSALSTAIRDDITKANSLAVKLKVELGPPTSTEVGPRDIATDLQEYAATVRAIYARARRLNFFILPQVTAPQTLTSGTDEDKKRRFELQVGYTDPVQARNGVTDVYEDVRYFAQNVLADSSILYGAINTCILPVLYALLGTCAFLLRTFEDQMFTRTFVPSSANSARFIIAAIGGGVVGLFNNLKLTDSASIPPLGVAFLIGYAVDVFFTFLDTFMKSLTRSVPVVSPSPTGTTKRLKLS